MLKVIFPCYLAVSFYLAVLSCASLKRGLEDAPHDESSSSSKQSRVISGETLESLLSLQSLVGTIDAGMELEVTEFDGSEKDSVVLDDNTSASSAEISKQTGRSPQMSIFHALTDSLLVYILAFDPKSQVQLSQTCKHFRNMIQARNPYLSNMTANLNIGQIPKENFHRDLQVFENIKFEPSLDGKVVALTFVYRITHIVLYQSELFDRNMSLVIEGAAFLAQRSSKHFMEFLQRSRFEDFKNPRLIFLHLLRRRDFDGLLALKRECPALLGRFVDILQSIPAPERIEAILILAEYFFTFPEKFSHFFHESISADSFLCLLASKLEDDKIEQVLQPWVPCPSLETFMDIITQLLVFPLEFFCQEQRNTFRPKLVKILVWAEKEFSLADPPNASQCRMSFMSLAQLLNARFNISLSDGAFTDDRTYDLPYLHKYVSTMYALAGNYSEALKFLPDFYSPPLSDFIANNAEFSSRLADANPQWIRKNYRGHEDLVYGNRHLFLAFHGIMTLGQFYPTATPKQMFRLAPFIFACGNMEEVREFLSSVPAKELSRHFHQFMKLAMPADRFNAIFDVFIDLYDSFDCWSNVALPIPIHLSPEQFVIILEKFDALRLDRFPFGSQLTARVATLIKIINSEQLRGRFLAVASVFRRHFPFSLADVLPLCRSPIEVLYGSKLAGSDKRKLILEVIYSHFEFNMFHSLDDEDFFLILIYLSRALYEDKTFEHPPADEQIENIKAPMWQEIYDSLTLKGKKALDLGLNLVRLMIAESNIERLPEHANDGEESQSEDEDEDDDGLVDEDDDIYLDSEVESEVEDND